MVKNFKWWDKPPRDKPEHVTQVVSTYDVAVSEANYWQQNGWRTMIEGLPIGSGHMDGYIFRMWKAQS